MRNAVIRFAPILFSLMFIPIAEAVPIYSVGYNTQLFTNPPDVQNLSETFTDGVTSLDETFTAESTIGGLSSTSTTQVNLADGSVRLYTEATGNFSGGYASAIGTFSDTIVFDLGGLASAVIPFSISVNGTLDGSYQGGVTQGSVQAYLNGSFAGTGSTTLLNLFGSTYTGSALVIDGAETDVFLQLFIAIAPSGFAPDLNTVYADALNSALFNWTLPEGVTYTSASGVFLSGVDDSDPTSVPEPGTLSLLVLGLLGMGAARRRREA